MCTRQRGSTEPLRVISLEFAGLSSISAPHQFKYMSNRILVYPSSKFTQFTLHNKKKECYTIYTTIEKGAGHSCALLLMPTNNREREEKRSRAHSVHLPLTVNFPRGTRIPRAVPQSTLRPDILTITGYETNYTSNYTKDAVLFDCIGRKQRSRCFQPYLATIQNDGGRWDFVRAREDTMEQRDPQANFARPKGNCG